MAVGVTVGLESLLQARDQSLRITLGFALPTIALVTALVHVMIRRELGRPIAAILQTMRESTHGHLGARVHVTRHDELGRIATGLNAMLERLQHSNTALQTRVADTLEQAGRAAALGQVAARVAHQAGTPLNLVSGYVQMMLDDPQIDDRVRTRLRTVDAQIGHVTRVLRMMLDQVRHTPRSELVRVPDVIEHVSEVSAVRLAQANIGLSLDVDPSMPPVWANRAQLEMALLNLVTNALDAMPAGGTLSIAASHDLDNVRVAVADTGPGIPDDIADRVFDPWVTTKPDGQGTGLGLAIVRDVVRAHAGTVSVRNGTPGAIVTISLPSAAPYPTAA
jgi:signal transduction histidine kinase